MAFLSGYTTRKKITIDKDKIDSNLTDFPVLVKLTSSNFDFSKANSDGYDIRFTSSDGTTLLKYERERHDATNKLAEYWVKIPSISSTANTIFYLYYRVEDTADGADPANVWDSNFKGVWHMKDLTTSTIEDSTSNNNDGTKKAANEPIQADGQIAKAQSFDGSDDYIDVNDFSLGGKIAVCGWVYPTAHQNWQRLIDFGNGAPNDNFLIAASYGTTGKPAFQVYVDSTQYYATSPDPIPLNSWSLLCGVLDGGRVKLYVNGVLKADAAGPAGLNTVVRTNNYIGRSNWVADSYFKGKIDEVRISSVARSAAWIKASYNSGNNSLVSYGGEEGIDNVLFFGCNF